MSHYSMKDLDRGIARCDAEIGSPAHGWQSCRRLATVNVRKTFVRPGLGEMSLDYCERHADRAHATSACFFAPKVTPILHPRDVQELSLSSLLPREAGD